MRLNWRYDRHSFSMLVRAFPPTSTRRMPPATGAQFTKGTTCVKLKPESIITPVPLIENARPHCSRETLGAIVAHQDSGPSPTAANRRVDELPLDAAALMLAVFAADEAAPATFPTELL